MRKWVRRVIRFVANVALLALAGVSAYEFWRVAPAGLHGAIFTGGSVLSALLLLLGGQLFGKFDKLLQDSEKYEFVRAARIYKYIGDVRHRLVLWLVAAIASLVAAAGSAYIIKEKTYTDLTPAIVTGYVALMVVGLAGARVLSAYLRIDDFRIALIKLIEGEDKRITALREMRSPDAIGAFTDDAPSHIGTLKRVSNT